MIRIILGNVGSGKTASTVRWMKTRKDRTIVTNIDVRGKDFSHVIKLKPEMIIKRTQVGEKKGEPVYKLELNVEFWKAFVAKYKKVIVVIDEAHTFFNPRRSMSKINIIMNDFLALLRRVLGSTDSGGELVLITQLSRRLDIIAKEMATYVEFCVHHYVTKCKKCGYQWSENNEQSIKAYECPRCKCYRIEKIKNIIEIWDFKNINKYETFENYGDKTYFQHFYIKDIRNIFGNYDTLQWDDLLSQY
jgi:predicted Zn-ribbon and HTH transcriptional regulator